VPRCSSEQGVDEQELEQTEREHHEAGDEEGTLGESMTRHLPRVRRHDQDDHAADG
jgi:hypothetical protein